MISEFVRLEKRHGIVKLYNLTPLGALALTTYMCSMFARVCHQACVRVPFASQLVLDFLKEVSLFHARRLRALSPQGWRLASYHELPHVCQLER
jgi:hypothetical protein